MGFVLSASNGTLTGSFYFSVNIHGSANHSPAPNSSTNWQALSMAAFALFGSRPFSNFPEASVRSPTLFEDFRMLTPSKHAASKAWS